MRNRINLRDVDLSRENDIRQQNISLKPKTIKLFNRVDDTTDQVDSYGFTDSSKESESENVLKNFDIISLFIFCVKFLADLLGIKFSISEENNPPEENNDFVENPDGTKIKYNYNSDGEKTGGTIYDKDGSIIGTIEYQYKYSDSGKKYISCENKKDINGNVVSETYYNPNSSLDCTINYSYNDDGTLDSYERINSNGKITYQESYKYDENKNKIGYISKSYNDSRTTVRTVDTVNNTDVLEIFEDGKIISHTEYQDGKYAYEAFYDASTGIKTSEKLYNNYGQIISDTYWKGWDGGEVDGNVIDFRYEYTYDKLGKRISTTYNGDNVPVEGKIYSSNDDIVGTISYNNGIIETVRINNSYTQYNPPQTSSPNSTITVEYDGSKIIYRYNSDGELTDGIMCTYSGRIIGSLAYKYSTSKNGEKYISYEERLNINGKVTRVKQYNIDSNSELISYIRYDNNGKITKTEHTQYRQDALTGEIIKSYSTSYYDESENQYRIESYSYDENTGEKNIDWYTLYEYDDNGNKTKESHYDGNNELEYSNEYEYIIINGQAQHSSTITKDKDGNIISKHLINSEGITYYAEDYNEDVISCPDVAGQNNKDGFAKFYYSRIIENNVLISRLAHCEYYEQEEIGLKYTIDYDDEFNQYVNIVKNGAYTIPEYSYPDSTITVKSPNGTVTIYRYDENGKKI